MKKKPNKIVVGDDEQALRMVVVSEFQNMGYETSALDLKKDAYNWVIQIQPDLIVSDIKPHVVVGFQFLSWLKAPTYKPIFSCGK